MKRQLKRAMALLLAAMLLMSVNVWGSEGAKSELPDYSDAEFITVDVFDSYANYQGLQTGWFAKVIKDRFNMELNLIAPNVAGGGDTLYTTRAAAGEIGDIIIITNDKMKSCIENGLIYDMTDELSKYDDWKTYEGAIESFNKYAGIEDSIYAIPMQVSTSPATEPMLGDMMGVTMGVFLPWDYYAELDYPEFGTPDELLGVMEKMVENHPETEDGKKTYAITLFKDWDSGRMFCAWATAFAFGFNAPVDNYLTNEDASVVYSLIDDDGIYKDILKMYFNANQKGLMDPDSTTQNWDAFAAKSLNRQALLFNASFMLWYNNQEHKEDGTAYAFIPSTAKTVMSGNNPTGGGYSIAVGATAKDPERMAAFIDWYASTEGMNYTVNNYNNVEGLTYTVGEDGKYVLTEFGKDTSANDGVVPEEFGGGTFEEGSSHLNIQIGTYTDINPDTGDPYICTLWTSTLNDNRTKIDDLWSEHYGADFPLNYLMDNDLCAVIPGVDWAAPEESTDLQLTRAQCNSILIEGAWKCVFASDEEEFEQTWEDMKETLYGMGYQEVLDQDAAYLEEIKELYKEAAEASN